MTHTTHRQFLHDERYYPDPDKFDPSRYSRSKESGLNEDDYNPLNVVFGFGRRWAYLAYNVEEYRFLTEHKNLSWKALR